MSESKSESKKVKYLTKTVRFGSKEVTLYSLDGVTWSTRRDELENIIERHESERITFGEIRGQLNGNKPIVPKKKEKFRPRFVANQQNEDKYSHIPDTPIIPLLAPKLPKVAGKKKSAAAKKEAEKKAQPKKDLKAGKAKALPVQQKKQKASVEKPVMKAKPVKSKVSVTPKKRESAKPKAKNQKAKSKKKAA